jgi:hypothetical protein
VARALLAAPRAQPAAPPDPPAPALPLAPDATLPAALSGYERATQRHAVDLPATLIFPAGVVTVRVRDVSQGGALIELARPPAPGTRATLVLGTLPDQPSLPCVVRHAEPSVGRCGVEFVADRGAAARAVEAILQLPA